MSYFTLEVINFAISGRASLAAKIVGRTEAAAANGAVWLPTGTGPKFLAANGVAPAAIHR
jgi:hypothetical protein